MKNKSPVGSTGIKAQVSWQGKRYIISALWPVLRCIAQGQVVCDTKVIYKLIQSEFGLENKTGEETWLIHCELTFMVWNYCII